MDVSGAAQPENHVNAAIQAIGPLTRNRVPLPRVMVVPPVFQWNRPTRRGTHPHWRAPPRSSMLRHNGYVGLTEPVHSHLSRARTRVGPRSRGSRVARDERSPRGAMGLAAGAHFGQDARVAGGVVGLGDVQL